MKQKIVHLINISVYVCKAVITSYLCIKLINIIKMYKEGKFIELEIYNVCGDPLELCYCTVGGITVWYNYGVDFMTPYGGAIGSTRDKIINTYGEPDFTDTYDDYFQYYYTFNDEYGYISTCHYSDTKECYMIELKNIVY